MFDRHLFGPGPSNAYPEATAALAAPMLGHLDPGFLDIMDSSSRFWGCERPARCRAGVDYGATTRVIWRLVPVVESSSACHGRAMVMGPSFCTGTGPPVYLMRGMKKS